MLTYNHKIGEQFTLVSDIPSARTYRIFRASDGRYFNKINRSFEVIEAPSRASFCDMSLSAHPSGSSLLYSHINFLPRIQLDLVFEFHDINGIIVGFERHTFGGYTELSRPGLCVLFGTLYDPSGNPLVGTRVDAALNKSGYFIDKHPIISPATSSLTDSRGYFELPLIHGINVTVSIPATGFTTRGYVPKTGTLELTGYCLVKESA
jgi:hypothetical protein